jgi:hypothetical protein
MNIKETGCEDVGWINLAQSKEPKWAVDAVVNVRDP